MYIHIYIYIYVYTYFKKVLCEEIIHCNHSNRILYHIHVHVVHCNHSNSILYHIHSILYVIYITI